ncbi:hypothetical protein Hanom_Chr15g01373881 [Helianthus anomalus]
MSQKKSNSSIHVPFSWETIPGVPKWILASPMRSFAPGRLSGNQHDIQRKPSLPLPPGSLRQPGISGSKRTLLCEEDPFLAAMIECTKDGDCYKGKSVIKKSFGTTTRMSKSFLRSCKHTIDVVDDRWLTRPSSLGPIVRGERVGCLKLI